MSLQRNNISSLTGDVPKHVSFLSVAGCQHLKVDTATLSDPQTIFDLRDVTEPLAQQHVARKPASSATDYGPYQCYAPDQANVIVSKELFAPRDWANRTGWMQEPATLELVSAWLRSVHCQPAPRTVRRGFSPRYSI